MWELDHKDGWAPKPSNCGAGEDSWVSWTARRSNQSILKEINFEYSLNIQLKLQYFGYLIRRADSLEKTLMMGKVEGKRRRECKRMRWLDSIIHSTPGYSGGQRRLACCSPWGCKGSIQLTHWTTATKITRARGF